MRRGSKVILCGGLWRWMMKQAGRQAVDYYVQMESHCITYLMYLTYRLPLVPVAWWGATVAIPTPTL